METTKKTEPKWFAQWWSEQQDRLDSIGGYADEVVAEGQIPLSPTPLEDMTTGHPEQFAALIEYAWWEWHEEMMQSPEGRAYLRCVLNDRYGLIREDGRMQVEVKTMMINGHKLTKQLFLQLKDEWLYGLENFVDYDEATDSFVESGKGEILGRVRHPDVEHHNEYALYMADGELRRMSLFIPSDSLDEIYPPDSDRNAVFDVLGRMWSSEQIFLVD